ncbi:MAG: site-specific DNA-methyltransferase [Clostridia bacterium]|nr:site-specific DNA-methyltransferase [Clostridia bacterium]
MELQIEYLSVDDLKPYERNNKKHVDFDVEQIAKSISKYEMIDPVGIWGKDNVIVEGHGRVLACKKLGIEKVPCIRLDHLTDEQRREYAIVHNKSQELAEYDIENLKFEIEDLDFSDFNFGFDFETEGADEDFEIIEDEAPELDDENEPITKLGDIWQLGRHRLMCGDSTDRATVELLMNGNKADMVFTDPPYGIDVVSDNGEVGANFGIAKKGNYSKVIADDTTDTAKAGYEILKELCDKLIIWGGNYFLDFLSASDGWLIWDKRVDSGIRNTFADGEMAYCSFHTPIRIYHQLWNGMIREGEKEKRVHPTQKPIKMLSDILNDFSKENEIVLDVFGGSGSTLIACERQDRTCYMMELDPKYCDVIIKRWETLTGKKAVLLDA